MYLISVQVSFA